MSNGTNGMGAKERDLLARITVLIDRCSAYQHRLATRRHVLREGATVLRLGRSSTAVLASIEEQMPDAGLMLQPSLND